MKTARLLLFQYIAPLLALACLVAFTRGAAGAIIDREKRMSWEDYAKSIGKTTEEVYKKFSATGLIICGHEGATANVVLRNDVVLTVAHMFYDEKCQPIIDDFSKCYFRTRPLPGQKAKYIDLDVNSMIFGEKCSLNASFDWVALKLKQPVPDVKPYRIGRKCMLTENMKVFNIAYYHSGFGDPKDPPPAVQVCNVTTRGFTGRVTGGFLSDCNSAKGASGSAITCGDESDLYITGMLSMGNDPSYDYKPYDEFKNATIITDVSGDSVRAVVDLAKSSIAAEAKPTNDNAQMPPSTARPVPPKQ